MYGGLPPDIRKRVPALPLLTCLGERGTGGHACARWVSGGAPAPVRVSGGDWVTLEAHPSAVGNESARQVEFHPTLIV